MKWETFKNNKTLIIFKTLFIKESNKVPLQGIISNWKLRNKLYWKNKSEECVGMNNFNPCLTFGYKEDLIFKLSDHVLKSGKIIY